jgi:hypothetical protein
MAREGRKYLQVLRRGGIDNPLDDVALFSLREIVVYDRHLVSGQMGASEGSLSSRRVQLSMQRSMGVRPEFVEGQHKHNTVNKEVRR